MGLFDVIFGRKKRREEEERQARERLAEFERMKREEKENEERKAMLQNKRREEVISEAKALGNNGKIYYILDFYLDCSHWREQNAILEKTPLALPVKRVDIDEENDIVEKYKVRSLPKLILVDIDGNEIHRWKGTTQSEEINNYLYDNGYASRPINKTSEEGANEEVKELSMSEKILQELRRANALNIDSIMERAVKIYNANSNIMDFEHGNIIIECLKLFIKVYQMDEQENRDKTSYLKPKILMFIALCNYKLDNMNRAFCIAHQGLEAIDDAIEDGMLVGIPKSSLGADTLHELINEIDSNSGEDLYDEDGFYSINPEDVDLRNYEYIIAKVRRRQEIDACDDGSKSARLQIVDLIDAIEGVQQQFVKMGRVHGNTIKTWEINQILTHFKIPLCFAWQAYGYGWHTDFCKEGTSLLPFMMFEVDCVTKTEELVNMLKVQSPFRHIERDSAITNDLIKVYTQFISDLKNGAIKL